MSRLKEVFSLVNDHDFAVFPVEPKDKTPLTTNGFYDATTDPEQIERWNIEYPLCGWAVRTGEIVVIDLDIKPNKKTGLPGQGVANWEKITEGKELPETLETKTQSGGRHIYFRSNGTELACSVSRLAIDVDVRGEGGYVVAPPTPGYTVVNDAPIAIIPDWLEKAYIDLLASNRMEGTAFKVGKRFLAPIEEVPDGVRNETLFRYACSLQGRGRSDLQIERQIQALAERANPLVSRKEAEIIIRQALGYVKGEDGHVLSDEYLLVLDLLGYQFSMSKLDDRVLVNGEHITDPIESEIKTQLRDFGYSYVNIAKDAYIAASLKASFHPVKQYLESVEWDANDHISKLSEHFEDEYNIFGTWLKRWLIGAVERVYRNGKQNRMLVLDGRQNLGKSYFVRWLASGNQDLYFEGGISPDNNDSKVRLMNVWIWEVSELGSTTRRADVEALKAFLSQERVRVRMPYGHNDTDKPALSSFIATVNNSIGFLNDPTGSRRYMSTTLINIDWSYASNVDRDQVWAQAKALFDGGESGKLTAKEMKKADAINADYEIVDPITIWLESFIEVDPDSFTETSAILERLRQNGASGSDPVLSRGISSYMKRLESEGVRPATRMVRGKRLRGYAGITIESAGITKY